jgi:hypothetical protein
MSKFANWSISQLANVIDVMIDDVNLISGSI